MLSKKLSLDLGTVFTRLAIRGENSITEERTLVGLHNGRFAVAGSGVRISAGTEHRSPISHGRIADVEALRYLINHLVNNAAGRQRIFRPDIVIAVAASMDGDDRRALLDILADNGVRSAFLIDSAFAAALGAGVPITGSRAHLIVDLGGGKTEIALLEQESTVAGFTLMQGVGDVLLAMQRTIAAHHDTELDMESITGLLSSLVHCGEHEERTTELSAGGRTLRVSSHLLQPAIDEYFQAVAEAIREVLRQAPPALATDISREGMILSGGGAGIEGAARFLTAAVSRPALAVGDARLCTIRGTTMALDNLDVLKRNLMYIH